MDSTADEFVKTDTCCYFCNLALSTKQEFKLEELPDLKGDGDYDVLLGVSGGVDSSMSLHHLVKDLKLRVLTYTIDNGWHRPEADENVLRMVEGLKVPFYRYTIDLDKFRELQGAFIKAGQKNLEIPTDHILMASALDLADKYNIKTIISGGNWNTESIMPESWGYQPRDLRHIKDVYKRTTGKKLTGLPMCGLWKYNWYKWVKGIKTVNLLDYFDYNREKAIRLLEREYGYKETGEKHCENYYTWWFQNYYLFEKYGIDKRKAHLSSLILSGQITREEAMRELEKNPVYPELGIEKRIMKYPKRSYQVYKTDERLWKSITILIRALRKLSLR
jgi:hypothetical protein